MVKRAYLENALRFHPDRLEDRSADALERAQFRMREVNEAWRVLRNPAVRAYYDDQLRAEKEQTKVLLGAGAPGGSETFHASAGGSLSTPSWRRTFDPEPMEIAELAAEDPMADIAARSPWRRWIPVIICLVVLTIVVLVAGTAVSKSDSSMKLQTVEQYANGTCVAVTIDDSQATTELGGQARAVILTVPCSGPNSGRVVGRSDFPVPCPNGSRAVVLPGAAKSLCIVS